MKRHIGRRLCSLVLISFSLFFGVSNVVVAQELLPRLPATKTATPVIPSAYEDYIVVKFHEGTGVRLRGGNLAVASSVQENLKKWGLDNSQLMNQLMNLKGQLGSVAESMKPLVNLSENVLDNLKRNGEARLGRELANMNLYFRLPLPPKASEAYIKQTLSFLNGLSAVEIAYVEPKPLPAGDVTTMSNVDLTNKQNYFRAAPQGIDVDFARTVPGGRGDGVRIANIEAGYRLDHEDLPAMAFTHGQLNSESNWVNHGTAELGIVAAKENGVGIDGIVPNVTIGYSSYYQGSGWNFPDAVAKAVTEVGAGGVIWSALHWSSSLDISPCTCGGWKNVCNYVPPEYLQANFDAIQTATANGVIFVEIAGNGQIDLDRPELGGKFDRSVRDSGAILVGASLSTSRTPACFTNHGSRVDLHAWGENVPALGYGSYTGDDPDDQSQWYTASFSGTSAAGPIVAGAIASLQGVSLDAFGKLQTAETVRDILISTGTPQESNLNSEIGVMPNLSAAINALSVSTSFTCSEVNATLDQHVTAGRAYVESVKTCIWGSFGCSTSKKYFASGSQQSLGSTGYTSLQLAETSPSYWEQASCPVTTPDPSPVVKPSVSNITQSLEASTLTIVGDAVAGSEILEGVFGGLSEANADSCVLNQAQFTCAIDVSTLSAGAYQAVVWVEDSVGQLSDKVFVDFTIEPAQPPQDPPSTTCVTALNSDHVVANRATLKYNILVYANGSNEYLGMGSASTSLEEQSPGVFKKVSACPN